MAETLPGAAALKSRLKKIAPAVLPGLAAPLDAMAGRILGEANAAVPRDSGELANSSFTDREVNERRLSVTATAGYESEHAPYVHEGVHFGRQLAKPKWLEHAAQGKEPALARQVADEIWAQLQKFEVK